MATGTLGRTTIMLDSDVRRLGEDVIRTVHLAVLAAAGFATAACSSGPLTTSSILGGSSAPPKAAANDTSSRTLQVASTSARAVKCGYYFDPGRLRAGFMAAEAAAAPGVDMGKVEQTYDMTFRRVAASIEKADDFCTEDQTREIKSDLTRHLAGDYAPRPRYVPATVASSPANPALDRERIFDPTGVRTPKPSE